MRIYWLTYDSCQQNYKTEGGRMQSTSVYCQSKGVQFGGYLEFDHEPTTKEVATAVSTILNQILGSIYIRELDRTEVILKTPDDFKNMFNDPIGDPELKDRWTVGVKISCKDAGYGSPCKVKLDEGVAPDPMEI
jgi:hypothetical protein